MKPSFGTSSTKDLERNKMLKTVRERRRRDRFNQSLQCLKILLLDHTFNGRSSKVEKAEILKATVAFLKKQSQFVVDDGQKEDACQQNFKDGSKLCLLQFYHFMRSRAEPTLPNLEQLMDRIIFCLNPCKSATPPKGKTAQGALRMPRPQSSPGIHAVPHSEHSNNRAVPQGRPCAEGAAAAAAAAAQYGMWRPWSA